MKVNKYQGCGNDFIIIEDKLNDYSSLAKTLCKQHYSIGADGLIYVDIHNLFIQFFNADGSEASLCINGLRCVGLYLYHKNIFNDYIEVSTSSNRYSLIIENHNPMTIKVIFPIIKNQIKKQNIFYNNKKHCFYLINVGNKHAVEVVNNFNIDNNEAKELAKILKKYNVNFVKILSRNKIKVLTYEKGVGFTNSCGSGSFAAVISLYNNHLLDEIVDIDVGEDYLQVNLLTNSIVGSVKKVFECDV